ncbi:MAG TPA: hypothetical protein VFA67_18840 [Candidatus Sulfotelmatobacter sp.]|nr:hypothetical protein [Candidatus Sulfotelmatobacter sp.]
MGERPRSRGGSGVHAALVRIGVLALQELIDGYNAHALDLLVNSLKQFLEKVFHLAILGLGIATGSRDAAADLADPVVKPAVVHTGEGARLKMP